MTPPALADDVVPDETEIAERVKRWTGRSLTGRPVVVTDTSDFMAIDRDSVVALGGEHFLVLLTEREKRFGLEGEPKFWVKRAVSLATGRTHILKMVFREAFRARVGTLEVTCTRSAEKEARVLDVFRGDARFMQGRAVRDAAGNLVRVIDLIDGQDLISHVEALPGPHEAYFERAFPTLLARAVTSLEAIRDLHEAGLCHGDIRNDHLFVEDGTGAFRWIDFDYDQETPLFDLWAVGNVLHHLVGKGFVLFRDVRACAPGAAVDIDEEDASVFFASRVMNLRKVYPHVPRDLNDVLLRFAVGGRARYDRVAQVVDDLRGVAAAARWPIAPAASPAVP